MTFQPDDPGLDDLMDNVADDTVTITDLLETELAGEPITYRQIDYWIGAGLVYADEAHPGSGTARFVPVSEIPVIRAMARLTLGGMRLQPAAVIARQLASGTTSVMFAGYDVIVGAASSAATNPAPPQVEPRSAAAVLTALRNARAFLHARKTRAEGNDNSRSAGRASAYEEAVSVLDEILTTHG